MKTNDTERADPRPSRWQAWLEYVNAVFAISSWGLYGPRAWPIDDQARQLLLQVMSRSRNKPERPGQVAKAPVPPAAALAGCCCGCAAS